MTWQSAKHDAQVRVAAMLERIAAVGRPELINLSDYEDEESFRFLCGMAGEWSLEYFRMVNKACARALRREGFKVQFVPIRMPEFFDWLARYDLKNTPANRAQFVLWTTTPEPKPTPQRNETNEPPS
jgi:hypothetical protein